MENEKPLSDFIAETLTGIVSGIKKAQEKEDHISPSEITISADHAPKSKYFSTLGGHLVHMIDFDIAVTGSDTTTGEGSAGVSVMPFIKVGTKAGIETENSTVSRLKFSIPIAMPKAEYSIGYRPNDIDKN